MNAYQKLVLALGFLVIGGMGYFVYIGGQKYGIQLVSINLPRTQKSLNNLKIDTGDSILSSEVVGEYTTNKDGDIQNYLTLSSSGTTTLVVTGLSGLGNTQVSLPGTWKIDENKRLNLSVTRKIDQTDEQQVKIDTIVFDIVSDGKRLVAYTYDDSVYGEAINLAFTHN